MESGGGGGGDDEELNDVVHRDSHQIDEWSSTGNQLEHVAKANLVPSTSRLLFLTVEYVEDPSANGSNPSYTAFEGEAFQQLADLEQRVVSPLDPNMSCTACYSPVQYNISRPPSPFQSSQGIIVNSNTGHPITHAYLNNSSSQPSTTDTAVSNETNSPGLIVMEDQFSPHHTSDNFVVSSSGRIISGYPTATGVAGDSIISSDKLLLNGSTEVSLVPSEMTVASLKPGEDGRLELLLSNGTIAYGLVETDSGLVASPSSIIQVKIPREYILAAERTDVTEDEENGHLRTVYNTLKNQGLIVESSDVGELRLVSELDHNEPLLDSALLEQPSLLEEQVGNIAEAMNSSVNETFNKDNLEMKSYWCDDCNKGLGGECAEHCIDGIISDKPVPSRARATLPAAYLAINRLPNDTRYGVFARKTIPKRTQFGPIEGVIVKSEDVTIISEPECGASHLELLIEMEDGEVKKLDVSNENSSNWMRFVRPAANLQQQNLVISQQGTSLFFTTTQTIHPKQELQVWYSSSYALKRNLPLLSPAKEKDNYHWPCFECDQKFNSSVSLQKHLNVHDTERSDESKSKKTPHRMSRRMVQKHLDPIKKYKIGEKKKHKNSHECQVCKKTFPRSYSLKRHLILLHSGENKYHCSICLLGFSHLYNLDRHMKKIHKKSSSHNHVHDAKFKKQNPLLCVHCNLTFTTASMLNLHTLVHAADNLENDSFLGTSLLTNSKDDIKCPQCTEGFSNKRDLIEHVSKHGKTSIRRPQDKQYRCLSCFKSFATCDRLQTHSLVHGDEECKPLQCNICKKRFLNNSALSCHIKTHSLTRLFECPICKKTFDQILSLKSHVHTHSKNGSFICPLCDKKFEEYCLIRKHIRAFHSDRKHKCTYCSKLFPTHDKLRMHMLRHSDHREFLCANCGKQFKRKDKLKEHMNRMHSKEREVEEEAKPILNTVNKKVVSKIVVTQSDYDRYIYKCHTCMSGFKRRGMLVNHLANRHPDITPDSVPELNLPILKTRRDYYCQYCEKIYKSSSKRKAHILKNHPGAELPMSNRQIKGGVPDIPGLPNPTFSQTVGSITTTPHGCQWCHKQYASKAKLLQHQRKKHLFLLPRSQQQPRPLKIPSQDESEGEDNIENEVEGMDKTTLVRPVPVALSVNNSVTDLPEYDIVTVDTDFTDADIVIDTSALKHVVKGGVITTDLLTQAMSELGASPSDIQALSNEQYVKFVQTPNGLIAQAVDLSDNFSTHDSFYTPYTAR